jgi:hypothetical protein
MTPAYTGDGDNGVSVEKTRGIAYLLCAGLLIVIVSVGEHLIGGQTDGRKNEARLLLKTEAWANLFGTEAWKTFGRELSMRRENDGSTAGLLLEHSGSDIIYRYDPVAQALHRVDFAKWQSATSPIVNCEHQFSPDPRRLEINSVAGGKLVDGSGRAIVTAGTFTTR